MRRLRQFQCGFNLVIEVLLISSREAFLDIEVTDAKALFQSRNRGSFDFKPINIEDAYFQFQFQSRNRGSFDFKILVTLFL